MHRQRVPRWLPEWAHPRFPLVANELRKQRSSPHSLAYTSQRALKLFTFALINPVILLGVIILLVSNSRLFGYLLYIPVILVGSVTIFTVEWLYSRMWLQTPITATQMIAREVERHSWDIVRSTPIPRYQIIMSKLAALGWMIEPAMSYILRARILLVFLMMLLYFSLQGYTFWLTSVIQFTLIGLAITLIPLIEIFVLACIGLSASSLINSTWQANFLSLGLAMAYRLVSALVFTIFFLDSTILAPGFLPLLVFPHWTLLIHWFSLPGPAWTTHSETVRFIGGVALTYLLIPGLFGTTTLSTAIWRVRHG